MVVLHMHVMCRKLDAHSIKCIFLGYKPGVKGYKLWCPETRKVIVSRDVFFDETSMIRAVALQDSCIDDQQSSSTQLEVEVGSKSTPLIKSEATTLDHSSTVSEPPASTPQHCIARDRGRREIKCPDRYIESSNLVAYASNVADEIESYEEPTSYKEAIASDDSARWIAAMEEELESLLKNRTWVLVKLPKGKKVVRCKWVFKKKEGTTGVEDVRYKARLVAKGYSQIPGVDFNDIFSPVVKHSSIRALFGIVAMHDLELEQLDVKTEFLHGDLEEDIYMEQPEGFVVAGKEDYVCFLQKSLYGLKQSPRQWYKTFDHFMISHAFKRSDYDSCVYNRVGDDGSFVYLPIIC